jgi:hypothetical protein
VFSTERQADFGDRRGRHPEHRGGAADILEKVGVG